MKKNFKLHLLLSSFLFISYSAQAVVYEKDKREMLTESSPVYLQTLGQSVAGMFSKKIISTENDFVHIQSSPLSSTDNLCEGERFYDEESAATCTGFLVAADVLATAGHCVPSNIECENNTWVFDWQKDRKVSPNDVYNCKSVIKRVQSAHVDFALIQLDRPVQGREALRLRKKDFLLDSDTVLVLGHPSGLPLTVSPQGAILNNSDESYFLTSTDTFHKNSGSPVINEKTLEVEGILIFGGEDYSIDYGGIFSPKCNRVRICKAGEEACAGEGVTRISNLQSFLQN